MRVLAGFAPSVGSESAAAWRSAVIDGVYQPDLGRLPNLSRATVAGISVAIAGNVLISFALNCQKLAHKRLERDRASDKEQEQEPYKNGTNGEPRIDEEEEGAREPTFAEDGAYPGAAVATMTLVETQPLLPNRNPDTPAQDYGSGSPQEHRRVASSPSFFARLSPWRKRAESMSRVHVEAAHSLVPVDVVTAHPGRSRGEYRDSDDSKVQENPEDLTGNESDYLKSKLWWLGFLLMNVGELGNFISYAFAPASVVAPLGTRDFFGIIIAVLGAVTVVLSTNPSDTRLDHEGLIRAISQRVFVVYSIIYIVGAIILSGLSESEVGKRHVFVDVGLCALFGGFTVLSTKAISTLLTKEWFEIFTEWITYPVIAVLLGTGIGQIKYLNRALMRFDSKIVVPTQFVMFNLSAIVGSAILYGDFKRATFHQIVTFLYGCGATFAGVFLIAWAPNRFNVDNDEEEQGQLQGDLEAGTTATPSESLSPRVGSLSRRNRATLVIPEHASGSNTPSPILRNRQSLVSLVGLSPAQYSQRLLLVNTPPQSEFIRPIPHDLEGEITQGNFRRRTVSAVGDEGVHRARRPGRRTISASPQVTLDAVSDTAFQTPAPPSDAELATQTLTEESSYRFAVSRVQQACEGEGAGHIYSRLLGGTRCSRGTVGDLGHPSGIADVSLDSWACLEGMIAIVKRTGHSSYYVEKGMAAMGKTPKQMGIVGDYRICGGAFPVWLENAPCCPIAVAACYSGSSVDDHHLVVSTVRDYLKKMGRTSDPPPAPPPGPQFVVPPPPALAPEGNAAVPIPQMWQSEPTLSTMLHDSDLHGGYQGGQQHEQTGEFEHTHDDDHD
ncbi:hypothetical protein NM688_g633 [Phlebia brevispora]|uniref:Uncharacterized protein n=1 Tax=Phlebia brevispora TaxID=194682 RepID=A0ACC1TDN3_9APHY|nr:hypothetical protein NM688_g633 [Phlebia brevispora]